jgi:hypothetical protein
MNIVLKSLSGLLGLGVDNTVFDFSDAPGGDLNLDDIFGDNPPASTTTDPNPNPQATTPETTPTTSEPVIKTKTGTVYKSIDDAVTGIEHKDALIAQLREQVRQQTGSDPLTARKPQPPQVDTSYTSNKAKYFEDVADAVAKKDMDGYMNAQQKLIWDTLGPLGPTITALSKANAEQVVVREIPDFKGFLNSEQYNEMGQYSPLLADAIRSAEMNPTAAAQLPELYKVAYLSSQGRRIPEILQSARTDNTQNSTPRPTMHSTPFPPPPQAGTPQTTPSMESKEGRQALIKQMEEKGIGNQRW